MLIFLCAFFTFVTNLLSLCETFGNDRLQWLCMTLWYHLLNIPYNYTGQCRRTKAQTIIPCVMNSHIVGVL